MKAYLVGGGIASLAAAAFLIRDGHLHGHNITIFEELDRLGGSLDASGSPEKGYILRGGRMFEEHYRCTFDLFSSIPTLDGSQTVSQEILQWNEVVRTASKARLVRNGQAIDRPPFGLAERQVLALERLAIEPETLLAATCIQDHFEVSFFETNFWLMWCTTFAFQPWHSAVEFKRYLLRFVHMIDGFNQLKGIMRTVFNQQDSIVRPLKAWLDEHGVRCVLDATVKRIDVRPGPSQAVERIVYEQNGAMVEQIVDPADLAFVTLGSMTEASAVGTPEHPALLLDKYNGGAWKLWESLAEGRPELGRPSAFCSQVSRSKWVSFTGTCHRPDFFELIRDLTGNVPGEGGLVTFADSAWLMSIVLPHQPHFIDQPKDVDVFWGYGLSVERTGDFVSKPMEQCGGDEILQELLGHVGAGHLDDKRLGKITVIPCMMPFITSQFLCREKGDRPDVVPDGWQNLGLLGQFVELPDDVVFTVEYSVRSAQTAVARLLRLRSEPPPVFKGQLQPSTLFRAFRALHDLGH